MKKVVKHKLLFLLILTTMLLVLSLGTNQILKHYNVVEQKELTAPANWYEDYTYELDETNHTITLKKYNGSASEVTIGASATISGVKYNTIVVGGTATSALFSNNTTITKVTFENGIKAGDTLRYLFYKCKNLEEINFNNFNTSDTTNFVGMFYECESLKSIDVSKFNTSKATTMSYMFFRTKYLKVLDLSSFDTRNVTNFSHMLRDMTRLQELDLSTIDTSNVEDNGLSYFLHNTTPTKIKIGPKTQFHILDEKNGLPASRGILVRESDQKEFNAIDLFKKTDTENMAGTYTKKTNIIKEMSFQYPVTYRINKFTTIENVKTSDSNIFKLNGRQIYINNLPTPTVSDYNLNGYFEATLPDSVTDANGNKYNLKVRIDNLWLYDLNKDNVSNIWIELMNIGTGNSISLSSNAFSDSEYKNQLSGFSIKMDITLEVQDSNGNPINGTFIFSAVDMDIASSRDSKPEYNPNADGYGDYSEGVNLLEGFEMGTIKMHQDTYLVKEGNRIRGTRADNATELSEFLIRASTKKAKFSYTGGNCGTSILAYYQPRTVEFEKQDSKGNKLPGAKLELYNSYNTSPFKSWTSTTSSYKAFLNPGEYTLKETQAPNGYNVSPNITLYADINDKLTVDGNTVSKVIIKDAPKSYQYTINYIDKENNTILDTKTATAPYTDVITAEANKKTIANYNYDSSDKAQITIDIDTSKNIINMYYLRKRATLVVKYVDANGNNIDATKNRNETVLWGNTYSSSTLSFTNYDFVNTTGDATSGTISKNNYEIIYHYKLKKGKVITHHYLYDGTETTTKLANDDEKTYDYTTTYTTSVSSSVTPNYELYRKTTNFTGTVNSPQIEVIYYYQLKDSTLETSISKTGPEEINDKNEKVDYKITYNASVKDYLGSGTITIIDTLPYPIDTSKSNLDGGIYNNDNQTITWTETVNINSYSSTENLQTISIEKNISLTYTGIVGRDRQMINSVKGSISLSNNSRDITNQTATDIKIYGQIKVRYIDNKDNELLDPIEETDLVGVEFTSEEKEIEGYKLIEKPTSETLEFEEEPQENTYIYEKIIFKVITKTNEGGTITGDEDIEYGNDSTKDYIIVKAEEGYVIGAVTVNGEQIDIPKDKKELVLSQFLDVKENKEVEVTFVKENPNTTKLTTGGILFLLLILAVILIFNRKKIYHI